MTKATETVLYAITALAVYLALYVGVIPTGETFQREVVPVLPWWGLVTFGCYALFCLGYGVFTLKDKEDKYYELKEQIKEAKTELKAKGIDI